MVFRIVTFAIFAFILLFLLGAIYFRFLLSADYESINSEKARSEQNFPLGQNFETVSAVAKREYRECYISVDQKKLMCLVQKNHNIKGPVEVVFEFDNEGLLKNIRISTLDTFL